MIISIRSAGMRVALGVALSTLGTSLAWAGPPYLTDDPVAGARSVALWNFGGSYSFTPDLSLLFTAGHSFAGDGNRIFYLGLYRTWGPGAP